jgi:isopentenyl-diphosphate delta-isomerase
MLLSENGITEEIQENQVFKDNDKTAATRKQDHIELAFKSQVQQMQLDPRFSYEPILAAHPKSEEEHKFQFLGKTLRAPLWVSSMTGGTEWARTINHNLARVAKDFGFGMGLGSCRSLLSDNTYLDDFAVRSIIGDDLPLYANLGIAQIEQLFNNHQVELISNLIDKLQADGLIVHVNPMQEWLQPEGDRFELAPIDTIKRLIDELPNLNIIVKEVGQGMGPASLKALMQLPIQAIDFAASGGTNFALLELLRSDKALLETFEPLTKIGHSAAEMVDLSNQLFEELGEKASCKQLIISGGVRNFLDGYYLVEKAKVPAIYGQASAFLKHARGSYEELYRFVDLQIKGYRVAEQFLRIKD